MLQFSGSPKTWYGRFDILIGHNKVPCSDVAKNEGKPRLEDPSAVEPSTSTEEQSTSKQNGMSQTTPLLNSRSQLIAQCITSSFLQRKYSPKVTLFPSIAVTKSTIQFYFYDCQNDVFLQSPELPLFNADNYSLKLTTIMATWLVLNYNFLMSGITERMKSEKFGFHAIGASLELYQKDLKYVHVTPTKLPEYKPWFEGPSSWYSTQGDEKRAKLGKWRVSNTRVISTYQDSTVKGQIFAVVLISICSRSTIFSAKLKPPRSFYNASVCGYLLLDVCSYTIISEIKTTAKGPIKKIANF